MAEVANNVRQEFWTPPSTLEAAAASLPAAALEEMESTCRRCGGEFMIGARFCHTCGLSRPVHSETIQSAPSLEGFWARSLQRFNAASASVMSAWHSTEFPAWMQYLHFHEIKRWIGLPMGALVAFIVGLGCVAGALGVSFFYKASNLSEFQAIQMWRIEWLLAATASFVAGILLKKPSE